MAVIIETIDVIGWQALGIFSITSAVMYVGLVILGYVTEGPRYQMRLDSTKPFRSFGRLLLGLGVAVIALLHRLGNAVLDPLFEASAQVGEWFTGQSSAETQTRYRSRFI
jgi:hypothetical protein